MPFNNILIYPPIIAHRGASALAPENTLCAFKKVKEIGLKWLEFDVMLAQCGEVVVIHDKTLARTTSGSGRVEDFPYSFLKNLDAGSWFSPFFAAERIPTLQAVLDLLKKENLAANIEIKALFGKEEESAKRVLQLIQQQEEAGEQALLISSFSRDVLKFLRQYSPTCLLGFLMDTWQADWESFCKKYACQTVNVNHTILTPERVAAIKSAGRPVMAYVVNDVVRAEELFSWGVDAIFSDCPANLERFYGRFKRS